jgi:xanthine dehydrogenase small subunit
LATVAGIDVVLARDFTPISDHRGGAGYRARAAANLIRRFQWETSSDVPLRVEVI